MTRRRQAVHELSEQAEELLLSLTGPDATPEDWDRHDYLSKTSSEYSKVFARCESVWQGLDDIGESRLLNLGDPATGRSGNDRSVNDAHSDDKEYTQRPSGQK